MPLEVAFLRRHVESLAGLQPITPFPHQYEWVGLVAGLIRPDSTFQPMILHARFLLASMHLDLDNLQSSYKNGNHESSDHEDPPLTQGIILTGKELAVINAEQDENGTC